MPERLVNEERQSNESIEHPASESRILPLNALPEPESLTQKWADQLNQNLANNVEAIIATGRSFIEAKKELNRGEFQRLFKEHEQPVKNPAKCSWNTANRLMKIASHPLLSNSDHGHNLPPSWQTLYQLSRLEYKTLEVALGDGRIHPELQRKEITLLKKSSGHATTTENTAGNRKEVYCTVSEWKSLSSVDREKLLLVEGSKDKCFNEQHNASIGLARLTMELSDGVFSVGNLHRHSAHRVEANRTINAARVG